MKSVLRQADYLGRIFNIVFEWLIAVLMLVAGIGVSIEVFCRYLLGRPHDFADELVLYLVLIASLLGAVIGSKEDRHTTIDVIFTLVKKGSAVKSLRILNLLVTIAACGLIAWSGIQQSLFLKSMDLRTPSSLAIPLWSIDMFLPIALFFCGLFALYQLIRLFVPSKGLTSNQARDQ